jgi:hypothetical protein
MTGVGVWVGIGHCHALFYEKNGQRSVVPTTRGVAGARALTQRARIAESLMASVSLCAFV